MARGEASRKPSLLYVLTTVDAPGGTERTIINQANFAAEKGHKVRILSVYGESNRSGFMVSPEVKVDVALTLVPPPKDGKPLPVSRRIQNYAPSVLMPFEWDDQFSAQSDGVMKLALQGANEDIVITSTPALTALASEFLPETSVLVCQEHRPTTFSGKNRIQPLVAHAARADLVVSLTQKATDGISLSSISNSFPALGTVPNALPDAIYQTSNLDEKVIVASGRLVHSKGFDFLISAAAYVVDKHPDWVFKIYGSGPGEASLRNQIEAAGLTDSVLLLGHTDDMAKEMSKASIFALSSRYEGQGLVILEAMATGLPVVSFDCNFGPQSMIDEGVQGFLVRTGDIRTFADRLNFLIENQDISREFGKAGQEKAKLFSNQSIYERWSRIFDSLMDARNKIPERTARAIHRASGGARLSIQELTGSAPFEIMGRSETDARLRGQVANVLDQNKVRFFALPPAADWSDDWHFIASDRQRKNVLAAASQMNDEEWSFRVRLRGGKPNEIGCAPSSTLDSLSHRINDVTSISIFPRKLPDGPLDLRYSGLKVEFWTDGDGEGNVQRISSNPYLPSFDLRDLSGLDEMEMGSVAVPVYGMGKTRPWWKCNFPIDVVYTWVDGDDSSFRREKAKHLAAFLGEELEADEGGNSWEDHRFKSRDELRFSMRSINAYMPWVRRIYLVTNGQVPSWLDLKSCGDRVVLVHHRDIFQNPDDLPTFNSHAIEANLHRIEGLSENFLYFNDDVFVGSPKYPEDFFLPNGSSKFFPSPTMIDSLFMAEEGFVKASKNSIEILKGDHGISPKNSMLHVPHALSQSHLYDICQRHAAEIAETSSARFRSDADVNLVSFLYHYDAYAQGKAVQGQTRSRYVGLASADAGKRLMDTLSAKFDFLCLGDGADVPHRTERDVVQMMHRLFPWTAPWEK